MADRIELTNTATARRRSVTRMSRLHLRIGRWRGQLGLRTVGVPTQNCKNHDSHEGDRKEASRMAALCQGHFAELGGQPRCWAFARSSRQCLSDEFSGRRSMFDRQEAAEEEDRTGHDASPGEPLSQQFPATGQPAGDGSLGPAELPGSFVESQAFQFAKDDG